MTGNRLSAWAFLRQYARNATRGNLALLAAVVALAVMTQAAALTLASGMTRVWWAASFAVAWGLIWWTLGWPPVQRWIWGGEP